MGFLSLRKSRWLPIVVTLALCWAAGAPQPLAPLMPALHRPLPSPVGSAAESRTGSPERWWMHDAHWFEGVSMAVVGPFFMLFPGVVIQLYGIKPAPASTVDTVPWFGCLVALMGYHQTFESGQLSRAWVEACLFADILWLYAFCTFISRHGENGRGWNVWSVLGSLTWTVVYAPLRSYWLWGLPANSPLGLA